jgi:hypothetical protein
MRNISLRLTEKQLDEVKKLSEIETKNINHILRDLIDIGLKEMGMMSDGKRFVRGVPRYEIMSTRASVEALMLLRKIAESSSPELVDSASQQAKKSVEEVDLTEIINL